MACVVVPAVCPVDKAIFESRDVRREEGIDCARQDRDPEKRRVGTIGARRQ
jgi:hypothetical protein